MSSDWPCSDLWLSKHMMGQRITDRGRHCYLSPANLSLMTILPPHLHSSSLLNKSSASIQNSMNYFIIPSYLHKTKFKLTPPPPTYIPRIKCVLHTHYITYETGEVSLNNSRTSQKASISWTSHPFQLTEQQPAAGLPNDWLQYN
jgi:hypothetical protein